MAKGKEKTSSLGGGGNGRVTLSLSKGMKSIDAKMK
jgi:hypothetical protein